MAVLLSVRRGENVACFPFFMDISGRDGLIVGGGAVAVRKVRALLPFGPRLTVAAEEFSREMEDIPGLILRRGPFSPELLTDRFFVVAAAGDRALNRRIAELCRERGILVNAVDDREACTFLFPALLRQGNLTVGVSTGGASPAAAAWVRDRTAEAVPAGFGEILAFLEDHRAPVREAVASERDRAACFTRLFRQCLDGGGPLSREEFEAVLTDYVNQKTPERTGRVYLVGAGCGGADMITLRGLRLLERCDAVVYDDLLDTALLDAAPPSAERFSMGKRRGRHSASQEEICALLIQKAREGKQVVRLKGGDPFVFGRGGEEVLALKAAGISVEVVPGVTSAVAVPALAGIPVTHRGLSRSVHIVTAHAASASGGLPEEFDQLGSLSGTLVVLMGVSRLEAVSSRLIAAGKPPETPAAVVSEAGAVRGTLETIAQLAADVLPPAVIVVGGTAAEEL